VTYTEVTWREAISAEEERGDEAQESHRRVKLEEASEL
jgi:hypothetical protein